MSDGRLVSVIRTARAIPPAGIGQVKLFADSPVAVRQERRVPRCPRPSFHRSDHFQRWVKKAVF